MIFNIQIAFYIFCNFFISRKVINNILFISECKKYKKITIRICIGEQLLILLLNKFIIGISMMITLLIRYRDVVNGIITDALIKRYVNNIVIFEVINTIILFIILKIIHIIKTNKSIY